MTIANLDNKDLLARSAILWDQQLVEPQNRQSSYWNVDFLLDLFSDSNDDCYEGPLTETATSLRSLSYQTVLTVVAFVVRRLRHILQELVSSTTVTTKRQRLAIPVAVAIPEGPLLPLAILAVHVLNLPFACNDDDSDSDNEQLPRQHMFAVLVPIEPGEGKDRIRHMLSDTGAAIVLCLDNDKNRLAEIIPHQERPQHVHLPLSTDTILLQSSTTQLIDFAVLAQQVARDIQQELRKEIPSQVIDKMNACFYQVQDSLQTRIAKAAVIIDSHNSPYTESEDDNRISHIAYTSGSTGLPKGSFSSIRSLQQYILAKNSNHNINDKSVVLLASALSFDPCLSDILSTFQVGGTLGLSRRSDLTQNLASVLTSLSITHVLCTPTLWSTLTTTHVTPAELPLLQVIALGGEPIPKHIVRTWGRQNRYFQTDNNNNNNNNDDVPSCRLFATYGVTEACVYQTMGEVFGGSEPTSISNQQQQPTGQNVGKPFDGIQIRICKEDDQDELVDVNPTGEHHQQVGEIVLVGAQLDEWSSYLNKEVLTRRKFGKTPTGTTHDQFYYRTGDRGFLREDGALVIQGRIGGEEGMLKINGVRVELGEMEAALVDESRAIIDDNPNKWNASVVVNAAVVARTSRSDAEGSNVELIAYCVLSQQCSVQVGVHFLLEKHAGVICNSKPMLALLYKRCKDKVRAGFTPSSIVFVSEIPLAPTGKRNTAALPPLSECILQDRESEGKLLQDYGVAGSFVAEQVSTSLNLQPCQESMLTTSASYSMLGGDSLGATRIVRALYAQHHGVQNSRFLGGKYGAIGGDFSAIHLIQADTLGDYVDFLDSKGICAKKGENQEKTKASQSASEDNAASNADSAENTSVDSNEQTASLLYESLMQATTQGHSCLAIALLNVGADPSFGDHGFRLGKVSGRNNRRETFSSSPLHLACLKGDVNLVNSLLFKGAKVRSPDASGAYPLHLAVSGDAPSQQSFGPIEEDQTRRLEIVKALLVAGAPLLMKDANKQTVLHCAARAGNGHVIKYIMPLWKEERGDRELRDKSVDWRDHWSRTPVHWAVLNGHVNALRLLLDAGCNPDPPQPRHSTKRSSIAIESPLELCERIHGTEEGVGLELKSCLETYVKQQKAEDTS